MYGCNEYPNIPNITHFKICWERSINAHEEIYFDFSKLKDWTIKEIIAPDAPTIVERKLEIIALKNNFFPLSSGNDPIVEIKMKLPIKIKIKFSLRVTNIFPPKGTPIKHPRKKGIIIGQWTLNLNTNSRFKFEPVCIAACKGIIINGGRVDANTPNRIIPPPKPIIELINDEKKLVKIINVIEYSLRVLGRIKSDFIISMCIIKFPSVYKYSRN